jgi:hypothetical protein
MSSDWPYVEVRWDDAARADGWVETSCDVARVITRGWVVSKTERAVCVAASLVLTADDESKVEQIGEVIAIPMGCVTEIREIDE